MRFLNRLEVASWFKGKTVAIVGSGPGCAENSVGYVDSHDIVVRVNNYRLIGGTGSRTDVFYSFFGTSIKKTADELKRDGVKLCMSKLPNAQVLESEWHRRNGKMIGVDYRPHFERRKNWWFCDTFVPTVEDFMCPFDVLGRHMPTTGFAAIWDVLSFNPKTVFLTGFDFFQSGIHNVNEPWRAKNLDDPFRHDPERELAWVAQSIGCHPILLDDRLRRAIEAINIAA